MRNYVSLMFVARVEILADMACLGFKENSGFMGEMLGRFEKEIEDGAPPPSPSIVLFRKVVVAARLSVMG